MVDLPMARFRQRIDPAAGGVQMEALSTFCYCLPGGTQCRCYPTPLWRDDDILPPGVSVGATMGTLGRIGIGNTTTCPPGMVLRSDGTTSECTFRAGDYVLF